MVLKKTLPSSVRLRPFGASVASPAAGSPVGLQEAQSSSFDPGVVAEDLALTDVFVFGQRQRRGEDGVLAGAVDLEVPGVARGGIAEAVDHQRVIDRGIRREGPGPENRDVRRASIADRQGAPGDAQAHRVVEPADPDRQPDGIPARVELANFVAPVDIDVVVRRIDRDALGGAGVEFGEVRPGGVEHLDLSFRAREAASVADVDTTARIDGDAGRIGEIGFGREAPRGVPSGANSKTALKSEAT